MRERYNNGTYKRTFALPRSFRETYPDKTETFRAVASFVGECLRRDPDSKVTARARLVNGRPYQVELMHMNSEDEVLGRRDFAAGELGVYDSPEDCMERWKAEVAEAEVFLRENGLLD